MAPGGGNSQDRRAQFFGAIKNQKLDTVRWALTHGGQNPGTRDDDGYTAIMLATLANKPKVRRSLTDPRILQCWQLNTAPHHERPRAGAAAPA